MEAYPYTQPQFSKEITKATKGSEFFLINFVLFVSFVVKSAFFFFGCGSAALGSLWLN
jgi:hypothetical protein